MKKTMLVLVLSVSGSHAFAESCFKVNIKQKIDVQKCTPVPVILTVADCSAPDKIVDEKTMDAEVDCKAAPLQLKMNYNGQRIVSDAEPAVGWGGVNYRVVKTVASGTAKAPVATAEKTDKAEKTEKPETTVKAEAVAVTAPVAAPVVPSTKAPPKKNKKRKVLQEKEVQAHAESVTEEAKVKDAATGEVAPAKPTGRIDVAPVDKVISEEKKEEVALPVNVKFSGIAWVENEDSKNFGYNSAPNFDASNPQAHQSLTTFFSNLQIDISKDKTNFTTILEVGEMINGETTTGGVQGGRKSVLEVRNVYLTHEFNPKSTVKVGLLPISSDPNAFITADHFSGAVIDYKAERATTTLWTAKAADNKPGVLPGSTSPVYVNPDQYWGVSFQPQFSEASKLSAYAVLRRTQETLVDSTSTDVTGKTQSAWYGATYDHQLSDRYAVQATGIFNQVKFAGPSADLSESYRSHLVDAKLFATWKDKGFGLLFEGLATSGASATTDASGKIILGTRRGFNSVGTSYLMTIATSDGVDDAPGTAKENFFGSLNQAEGIQIGMVKASQTFSDKWTGFLRAGTLRSTAASATGGFHVGDEIDLNATYELSPGTTLQFDYGYFKPGTFYEKKDSAHLMTTRLKFSF